MNHSQHFEIRGMLPGMNEMIAQLNRSRHAYGRMKAQHEVLIKADIRRAKVKPVNGPCALEFHWIEPNKKRDLDNIAGGKKIIIDAMRAAGILPNDGWAWVMKLTDTFGVKPDAPGVSVYILEEL